jgi:hypothetical protein
MDLAINLAGLIGVALLAVPALYASKYGRLVARLSALAPVSEDQEARVAHEAALDALKEHQGHWSRSMSVCLIAGTALGGLAYLLGILKALLT